MIDLHTHSIFSDGELIPSELVRRAEAAGYRAIAITDHGDQSNLDFIIPRVAGVCKKLSEVCGIQVIPGIELTHVPPVFIGELAVEARKLGARLIVVHGETIVEPVAPGTNAAALEAPIDILAHPGLISEREVRLAAEKGIYLEITTRKGHSLTNGHVAVMARQYGASLVLNTDTHGPQDLTSLEMARKIAIGAGLSTREVDRMFRNSENLVKKVWKDKVPQQRVKKNRFQNTK
ncbi:MAG: histidinol phosphate phosphatase domain-containing protein [Deltaproteobacteria bacterium]|nr:histidinol phosphate phosphatase domain-containing protein [Deltaproteobacteria bacterium]